MSTHLFAAAPENLVSGTALACLNVLVALALVCVSVGLALAVSALVLLRSGAGFHRLVGRMADGGAAA